VRSLAGRFSWVQSGLTVVALAAVVLGTWLTLTSLLERRRRDLLQETARRGVELFQALGVYAQDAEFMQRELAEIRPSDVRLELRTPDEFVLASSGPDIYQGTAPIGCYSRGGLRICSVKADVFRIVAISSMAADLEERDRLVGALVIVSLLAALAVVLVSRGVARRTLRPLTALMEGVARIEPGGRERLVAASEFVEIEGLRARFDELLERFEEALARERRLTAQASHELRTPLGVARGEIESMGQSGYDGLGRARALGALDRLADLVDVLLWFARVQEPLDEGAMSIVNLADVVRDELAEREGIPPTTEIRCDLPDEALVRGDETLLRRVVANLVDNALKHGDRKRVEVSACPDGVLLELRVSNSGPELAASIRERLFEPFYRGSRTESDVSGFGLGLPFARAVARAHGGDVALRDGGTDETTFVLILPLVEWMASVAPEAGHKPLD
jgi:signal transduction histidine kinase